MPYINKLWSVYVTHIMKKTNLHSFIHRLWQKDATFHFKVCQLAVIQCSNTEIPVRMQKLTNCLYVFSPQYHINKLSIMSSDNHMNNSEKEVDEVDAALSDLEITLEGGKTSNTLVPRPHLTCFLSIVVCLYCLSGGSLALVSALCVSAMWWGLLSSVIMKC